MNLFIHIKHPCTIYMFRIFITTPKIIILISLMLNLLFENNLNDELNLSLENNLNVSW
jgi:hypothetical protein